MPPAIPSYCHCQTISQRRKGNREEEEEGTEVRHGGRAWVEGNRGEERPFIFRTLLSSLVNSRGVHHEKKHGELNGAVSDLALSQLGTLRPHKHRAHLQARACVHTLTRVSRCFTCVCSSLCLQQRVHCGRCTDLLSSLTYIKEPFFADSKAVALSKSRSIQNTFPLVESPFSLSWRAHFSSLNHHGVPDG